MDTFKVYEAFPDISPNPFGFAVDPIDEQRVWFFVRNTGTNSGPFGLGYGLEVGTHSDYEVSQPLYSEVRAREYLKCRART